MIVSVIIVIGTVWGVQQEYKPPEEEIEQEDVHKQAPGHIGEDLFGLVLSSLVRNTNAMATGTSKPHFRMLHIVTCVSLQLVNIILQVYILYFMQSYVGAAAEEDIRREYDKYEVYMYGNDEKHMDTTANGYHRGHPEHFNPSLFASLDDHIKGVVCKIPLSQPTLFGTILFVWSLTCIQEIRFCFEHFCRFLINTPTIDTMADGLQFTMGDEKQTNRPMEETDDVVEVLIVGLTPFAKCFVALVLVLPRLLVALLLLWLGCIWLCATPNFEGLLCNVVALAFIVQLKDLVYVTVAPIQAQHEAEKTLVMPLYKEGSADVLPYFGSFGWLALCAVWVVFFIHFQPVLPVYKWDVRAVCTSYLESLTQPLHPPK